MIKHNQDEIIIPFVGAFSSGKSSLINALLGEDILSTDIAPETLLPVELRAGGTQQFVAHWPDGRSKLMSKESFLEADFSELAAEDGWINAQLPILNCWSSLVLVDLPGWSSGYSEHERHIDEYLLGLIKKNLDKNIVFVVVVSADEGTLRDNVRERLQEMDIVGASYLLAITKSDKRTSEDLLKIAAHLSEMLATTIGKPPAQVLKTSARKKQIEELRQAINAQQALTVKEPAVDKAALAQAIDLHIERLNEASCDRRDIAIYVFDDFWDEFDDKWLDSYFDCVIYLNAKFMGKYLLSQLEDCFKKFLERNVASNFPLPGEDLLDGLRKLNLSYPDFEYMDEASAALSRKLKKHINLAIEKSKPGIFSSDDPDAVGGRICSRLRGMRSEFRSDVIECAHIGLGSWIERQKDDWQRLRRLIAT